MSDPDVLDQAQAEIGRALRRSLAGQDPELARRVREGGEQLARQLVGLIRLPRLHALDNEAFQKPVAQFHEYLVRMLDLLGTVHVATVEDQVYLNDVRLRPADPEDPAHGLVTEIRPHGVGGIAFLGPLEPDQIRSLALRLAEKPDPVSPRAALSKALAQDGLRTVELRGAFRYRLTGETVAAPTGHSLAARSASLVDESLDHLAADRVPRTLPVRRVVTAILEVGAGAEGLLEEPAGASAYAAHAHRVCTLALLVGAAAGFKEAALQDLGVSALLHDVGYAAREGAEPPRAGRPGVQGYPPPYERHTSAGARLFLRQRGFHAAKVRRALVALFHHSDASDTNAPQTVFGRIIRVCEDYDNLVRARGAGLPPAEALRRIVAGSGTRYDPLIVQLLVNTLGRYPPGTMLRLADGRIVCSVSGARDEQTFERPTCRVVSDAQGNPAEGSVDLAVEGEVVEVVA